MPYEQYQAHPPGRQTLVGRLVEARPFSVADLDESSRRPFGLIPGDRNYKPGRWDVGDLQAEVDRLADGEPLSDQDRHDLLLQIGLRGQDVRLPRKGIAFSCEACGENDHVRPQSQPRVVAVPWVFFPDGERVSTAMQATSSDVGDRLAISPYHDGWAGYRLLVVCAGCLRSHRGKRGLQCCAHEEPEAGHKWWRCDEVARGRDFCAEHSDRPAQYRREKGRARRAPANVPALVAEVTPEELSGPAVLLLNHRIEAAKAAGAATQLEDLKRDQQRVREAIERIVALEERGD